MRNREIILKRIDSLDSILNVFNLQLNQGNREACYEGVENMREQIEQIKGYIESESISGSELNS